MKRIYIAGPMRGIEDFNRAAFTEYAARLRALGWAVESPVEIGGRFGTDEEIAAATLTACVTYTGGRA